MLRGMTAYASREKNIGSWQIISEIWSYNHKFLKIDFIVPHEIKKYFHELENLLNSKLKRGKITLKLNFFSEQKEKEKEVFFDKKLCNSIYNISVKNKKNVNDVLTFKEIFKFPGVLEIKDKIPDFDKLWPSIEILIKKTLDDLINIKKIQGKNTSENLKEVINEIKKSLIKIKKIHKKENNNFEKHLKKKVEDISGIKTGRIVLQEEAINFIRNCDINEEITRIEGYLKIINTAIKSKEPVGKKMDFIAQELLRETNTIGAKKDNFDIKKEVVNMKEQVEKLREQSQNIE